MMMNEMMKKKMDEMMMKKNGMVEDCEVWYDDLDEKNEEGVKNWIIENLGDVRRMDMSFIDECVLVSGIRYRDEDDDFVERMIGEGDKIDDLIRIGLDDEDLEEMDSVGVIDYIERRYGRRVWDLRIRWESYDDGDILVDRIVLGGEI